ncbi:MAG: carboxylesterase family protein [Lachnospiraceae bacterium]
MVDPGEIREVDTLLRLPILKITAHKADQNGAPVYSYVFTEGAYHGAEIPYVFGHRDDATGQVLSQAWISFARDGVPSAEGMPEWEPYTRAGGAAMLLGSSPVLAHHHDEELLHLLEPDYTW